jgi:hypothetical protein
MAALVGQSLLGISSGRLPSALEFAKTTLRIRAALVGQRLLGISSGRLPSAFGIRKNNAAH